MATGLGFPAITTPNALDLRAVQTAVGNARQRIEQLERLIVLLQSASATGTASTTTSAQLNALRNRLLALEVRVTAIENWFSGDDPGIVVWNGGTLITRLLEAGTGVTIVDGDGVAGNPVISAAGGDGMLFDWEGRLAVAADGSGILEASGV
jgi:hypothetical protein